MKISKRYVEWTFIEDAVERISLNIIKKEIKFDAIIGLPRGGLIPAVMLSHKLGIPYLKADEDDISSGIVLIVDDICDSGETLIPYKEYQDSCYTATIHYKTTAKVEPDFWYRLVSTNEWIVYPWENKDSETIRDYKTN